MPTSLARRGAPRCLALAATLLALVPFPLRAQEGQRLASALGCGACHAGLPGAEEIRTRAPVLGPDGETLEVGFIFEYLGDPIVRRPEIAPSRMPDFRLDEGERLALALYLGKGGAPSPTVEAARQRFPSVDADRGRRIFGVLGCASCHGHRDVLPAQVGPDLSREGARVLPGWLSAFLAAPTPVRGPAHPAAPGSRMPDFRLSPDEVAALSALLSSTGRPRASDPTPLSPFMAARTQHLLVQRLSCLGCHETRFGGGGIGPSLVATAERLRPEFVVEMITDPSRAAPGAPMPHQPLPDAEASRVARLLLDTSSRAAPPPPRSLSDPDHPAWSALPDGGGEDEGAALYARHCGSCHGPEGRGNGWNAGTLPVPPAVHADPEAMGRRPDDTLYDGIHAGGFVLDGSARMPGFGSLLSDAQIRALVAYIRVLCACAQPAWAGGEA